MILNLVPFESVGQFVLKSEIKPYLHFEFKYTSAVGYYDYERYDLEDLGISMYVENNLIESISCQEELLYKGRNIINMYIDEFMLYYDLSPNGDKDTLDMDEDETQDVYQFDNIGLQIWCRDNIIVTAIASYFIE